MEILAMSKEAKKVTVSLNTDELVRLCNVLHASSYDDKLQGQLYSDLIIASNLCRYGHIDDFALSQINKSRGIFGELKCNK